MSKKAILVVSFGTTYEETLMKNIGNLENKVAESFKEYDVFRAFTSSTVIKRLKDKNILVDDLEEALWKAVNQGYTDMVIFPTHIMNGFEYEKIVMQAESFKDKFESIKIGYALFNTIYDIEDAAERLVGEYPLKEDEAMIFVGHGTEHQANMVYSAMNYIFAHIGHPEFLVTTVEGFPNYEDTFRDLKKLGKKSVKIAPLLLVAGDHANNDIAGDDDESLKMRLKALGYEVTPYVKGLGEYSSIVEMYINHLKNIIE